MATLDPNKSKKKKKKSSKRRDTREKIQKAFTIPYIDPEEIELKGLLGKGCFGKVYAAQCRAVEVAVKIPKKQNLSSRALRSFVKEVEIMSKIYHPNVCLFMGACTEPGKIRIVSEKLETDLDNKIHDMMDDIPLTQRIQWAKETCQGIAWLHGSDPPIVHRDLKPANMLLDEHNKIKVCDFGLSQFMEDGLYDKEPKGTPLYMAPEVMRKETITEKVDVYSIGVITWELLTREDPFADHEDYQIFVDAVCNDGERPIIPRWCPPTLREVISSCWVEDPALRPSVKDLIPKLDQAIEECAALDFSRQIDKLVKDSNGRRFWKKCFPSKLSVGWREFVRCLYKEIDVPLPVDPQVAALTKDASIETLRKAGKDQLRVYAKINSECAAKAREVLKNRSKGSTDMYRIITEEGGMTEELRNAFALKALLNAEATEVVTVDEFGKLLERLGPLNIPEGDNGLLNRVADLVCNPWFHGEVATKTAESMLRVAAPGTYLVRFSNSSRNSYCLSYVSQSKKVVHTTIPHTPGRGVEKGGKFYPGMKDLLDVHAATLKLSIPCPGSRFAWLSAEEEDVASVAGYGVED